MKVQLLVWGTQELVESIINNYSQPKILEHVTPPSEPLLPMITCHINHHIGTVCSCLLYMSNILLVDDYLCDAKQPVMQLPDGYDMDINIGHRAVEHFKLEMFPSDIVESYKDYFIVINLNIPDAYSVDIEAHFDACLRVLSPVHCFAWHIISYTSCLRSFKQILVVKSPDKMTLDRRGGPIPSAKVYDTNHEWVSLIEDVISVDDEDIYLLRDVIADPSDDSALMLAVNEPSLRVYWPAEITPDIFREFVSSFVDEIKPYATNVIYTNDQEHFTFLDNVRVENDH